MDWVQRSIKVSAKPRGFHLITEELLQALPELGEFEIGVAHFFLKHTSASLSINENADPEVRDDLERHLNIVAPENAPHIRHTAEGPDDMPAHIKAALLGVEISIPIENGALALGTWQGVYLGEHRDHANGRTVLATLRGKRYSKPR